MQQRMLEAIRRHFRTYGGSPSHEELAISVGIRKNAVWRPLRDLEHARLISLRPGPRGIGLHDRAEMLSNTELELAVLSRGGRIIWPKPIIGPIVDSYAHMLIEEADCSLPLDALLAQIDAGDLGEDDGAFCEDDGRPGPGCEAEGQIQNPEDRPAAGSAAA